MRSMVEGGRHKRDAGSCTTGPVHGVESLGSVPGRAPSTAQRGRIGFPRTERFGGLGHS
jgi:hypothetical protein